MEEKLKRVSKKRHQNKVNVNEELNEPIRWMCNFKGCQHYFSKTNLSLSYVKLAKIHGYNKSNINEHNISVFITSKKNI